MSGMENIHTRTFPARQGGNRAGMMLDLIDAFSRRKIPLTDLILVQLTLRKLLSGFFTRTNELSNQ